jgi:sugar lactone lactonase YvrE
VQPAGNGRPASPGQGSRWWIAALIVLLSMVVFLGVAGLAATTWPGDDPSSDPANAGSDRDGATPDDELAPLPGEEGEGFGGGDPGGNGDGFGGFGNAGLFEPDSVAIDEAAVWVSDSSCGLLIRLERSTGEVLDAIDIGGSASGVAIAGGSVWVGDRLLPRVVRLEPEGINIQDEIPIDGVALGLDANDTEVWAADPVTGAAHQFDAATGELVMTVKAGMGAHDVAVGDGVAWVTNFGVDTVTRIDRTGQIEPVTIPVGAGPLHAVEGAGSVWITNFDDGTVSRLDRSTGDDQAVIEVGPSPHALTFATGSVWIGTESDQLWRIDPATDEAELVDGASFSSIDMASDGAEIWVADSNASTVVQFDAGTSTTITTTDLAELGTCEEIRGGASTPSPQPVGWRPDDPPVRAGRW